MKIHGHPHCTYTRQVLLTLAEKNAEAELVLVDLATGEHKRAAHLARHPFGKVPVLEHDGRLIYETSAIIRYLDALLPGVSLMPTCLHARALVDRWLSIEASYVGTASWAIISQLVIAPMFGLQADLETVQQGRGELCQSLDVLEQGLHNEWHLAGDAFSLADIAFIPRMQFLEDVQLDALITERPALSAWWTRVRARPAWQTLLLQNPYSVLEMVNTTFMPEPRAQHPAWN
jgi:glutathione S-transferase